MKQLLLIGVCALAIFSCKQKENRSTQEADPASGNQVYLLVGTYTSGTSEGIYVYNLDIQTGKTTLASEIKNVSNPSYLTVSPDERFVYSVSENEKEAATVNAFSFDKSTGKLQSINSRPAEGAYPCYVNMDATGKFVAVANYGGGNISIFKQEENGSLSTVPQVINFTEGKSHLHSVVFSPDNNYLYACDLGMDKIYKFSMDKSSGSKTAAPEFTVGDPASFQLPAGSGPRHLVFHPNNKFAYVINEISGTVIAFNYQDGNLLPIQEIASDTTSGTGGKGSADIHITSNGRFLYSSNRLKADGISIFSVDSISGQLTRIGYQSTGIHPRNFILTPNDKYLLVASRDSNTIQVFEIGTDGLLSYTGEQILLDKPVCLKFIGAR